MQIQYSSTQSLISQNNWKHLYGCAEPCLIPDFLQLKLTSAGYANVPQH